MVLRCSLLGHDYGESGVDREREERGSEVVVTVQEYEECVRCGDRHVISENTEVTSLSAARAAEPDARSEPNETAATDRELPPESDTDTGTATKTETPASTAPQQERAERDGFVHDQGSDPASDSITDDATIIDADTDIDADPDPDATTGSETESEPAIDANTDGDSVDRPDGEVTDSTRDIPTDENGEPITDDGEILEDDDPEPERNRDREHGEWPDSEDVGPPVDDDPNGEWPDADDYETDPTEDDAVVLEHDSTAYEDQSAVDARTVTADPSGSDAQFNAGETDSGVGANTVTGEASTGRSGEAPTSGPSSSADPGTDTGTGTGIERVSDAPAPGDSSPPTEDVPTEFYCPRCDFVTTGDRGSLRTGDICPECRKGYLGERAQHSE
ncbi:DUF7093 family protein [Natrialba aegyptia]|uniref:Uncharacterized protein n=1 Tax=Natrialba aegyptia DSM 13077 TaxID=1227491 RepID=M0B619_9EURY|nr:hypothetical protein [Natrialba aegyptia]ELZ05069.1 hypothetical protein C480_10669 [Natrialba aegyptia DSM 13077]